MGAWNDLIYAARLLAKARAFTFVCIVSLGIGMAPVIAVPYLARVLKMPPPGVNNPEGLVEVITTTVESRQAANSWSYADYMDLRNANTGISIFGSASTQALTTLPGGQKLAASPMYVSADYFKTLGVKLARGTGFEGPDDARVIVGYGFWQTNLNSDPEIIGKTIKLDDTSYVVTGVAPENFVGHLPLDGRGLFVPLERYPLLLTDRSARFDRSKEWLRIHGRLMQGVSVAQANGAVAGITSQLAKENPATNKLKAGAVEEFDPVGVTDRSQLRALQALAMTLTGAVLLVVCLNISGMMQVRSAMRERELSIRQAIGATRFRLARHLLAEAVLLAVAGGTIALLVLFSGPVLLFRFLGQPMPVQLQYALQVDPWMIAITIGICFLTSLVFGFLPALRFSRPVIISSLKDDAGVGGARVGRIQRFTAALQVAIAVPLLVMGGISLDRVRSTATADLGFQSEVLYAAPLDLDVGDARTPAAVEFRMRGLRDNLVKASGITSVTVADGLPLAARDRPATVSLQTKASEAPTQIRVQVTRVGGGYLNTLGVPLLSGRDFSADDSAGSENVTIVTKALADRLFSNAAAEAIGKRLTFAARTADDEGVKGKPVDTAPPTLTIVGVTGDFPTTQMDADRAQLLLPLAQYNLQGTIVTDESGNRLPDLLLIARAESRQQPEKIIAALENVVRESDPEFRRERIITGVSLRKSSMDNFLKQSAIAGVAGGVILMLSALGIYGVVGLMVATRTREIAVRIALGASRAQVLGMILFDVVKLTTPGIAVGLILAVAILRLNAENMGISLSNVETLAYFVGGAVAMAVAVLASLAPARRAASVLPMVAMRSE